MVLISGSFVVEAIAGADNELVFHEATLAGSVK
jgi:hypothetical protein